MKKEFDFEKLYYKFDELYVRQNEVRRMLKLLKKTNEKNECIEVELSLQNELPISLKCKDFLPMKSHLVSELKKLDYDISSVLGELNQADMLDEVKRRHYNDWEDDFVEHFEKTHDLIF